MATLQPSQARTRACRADGARPVPHSLQTVRAPPAHADLRAHGQDPGALLCTALTNTPRVNRTDVETLRPSFGVRPPVHLLPSLSSDRRCRGQRFAKIAQADAVQLARLPGFDLKKVARLRDAFERPFRTGKAGDALPAAAAAPCLRLRLPLRPPQPLHPLCPRGLAAAWAAPA